MQSIDSGGFTHCPKCGDAISVTWVVTCEEHNLSNPHPDAFKTKSMGKTLRQWGIKTKGRYAVCHCPHCGRKFAASGKLD